MTEFIWHWTKGNKKIYTKRTDVAERAMKEGFLVMGIKERPHILETKQFFFNKFFFFSLLRKFFMSL